MSNTRAFALPEPLKVRLAEHVATVVAACPGQSEYRYVACLRGFERTELGPVAEAYGADPDRPLVLTGLPVFDSIESTKILTLMVGEAIGRCVGYADYNHSYITDIRPTPASSEKSASFTLLGMHQDLAWAADSCRPRTLVLVPHIAEGDVPATFLAPTEDIIEGLSPQTRATLSDVIFEARSGGSLAWRYQRVQPTALLTQDGGRPRLRLNFETFAPAAHLDEPTAAAAASAIRETHDVALAVGRRGGHAVRRGQALLIPNDHCAHGRDTIEPGDCDRLLLRSYVVPEAIAAAQPSTMLRLSD